MGLEQGPHNYLQFYFYLFNFQCHFWHWATLDTSPWISPFNKHLHRAAMFFSGFGEKRSCKLPFYLFLSRSAFKKGVYDHNMQCIMQIKVIHLWLTYLLYCHGKDISLFIYLLSHKKSKWSPIHFGQAVPFLPVALKACRLLISPSIYVFFHLSINVLWTLGLCMDVIPYPGPHQESHWEASSRVDAVSSWVWVRRDGVWETNSRPDESVCIPRLSKALRTAFMDAMSQINWKWKKG